MGTDLEGAPTDRDGLDAGLLERIAGLYGVSPELLRPMSGGHFAHVFEYTTAERQGVLRIMPPAADSDPQAVRAIMEWLAFVTVQDGPVPHVLRSCHGNVIEVVNDGDRAYIVSAFEKAPGVLAEGMAFADWNDELFEALGATLGRYHRIARQYAPPAPDLIRPRWDAGSSCFNPADDLVDADPMILERRDQALAAIRDLPQDRDSYGLAHLDLHFGNFYIDITNRKIVLLDFDDCGYGWYMMDVAMLLFDVLVVYDGLDRREFGERFLKCLLRGYQTEMSMKRFWIEQLSLFLKLLEIGVYLMLYRIYDAAQAGWWDSRFMPGRRERIERNVPYVDLDVTTVARYALGE